VACRRIKGSRGAKLGRLAAARHGRGYRDSHTGFAELRPMFGRQRAWIRNQKDHDNDEHDDDGHEIVIAFHHMQYTSRLYIQKHPMQRWLTNDPGNEHTPTPTCADP